jgi:hypothetical protein
MLEICLTLERDRKNNAFYVIHLVWILEAAGTRHATEKEQNKNCLPPDLYEREAEPNLSIFIHIFFGHFFS